VKLFEIKAPDGRLLRQEHQTIDALKAQLVAGYEVTGIVYGAASDGTGGIVEKIGGPSLLRLLLEAHGDELIACLEERGYVANPRYAKRA
jgi:hypothetical protein